MSSVITQKIRDQFSARLKQAERRVGIDQLSLRKRADALGISKSYLESLEKAEKLPARAKGIQIAAICGVREEWLMEGKSPITHEVTPRLAIDHWSEEDRRSLISVYESIDRKYRKDGG